MFDISSENGVIPLVGFHFCSVNTENNTGKIFLSRVVHDYAFCIL